MFVVQLLLVIASSSANFAMFIVSAPTCNRVEFRKVYVDPASGCNTLKKVKHRRCEGSCGTNFCCEAKKIKTRRVRLFCPVGVGRNFMTHMPIIRKCRCETVSCRPSRRNRQQFGLDGVVIRSTTPRLFGLNLVKPYMRDLCCIGNDVDYSRERTAINSCFIYTFQCGRRLQN